MRCLCAGRCFSKVRRNASALLSRCIGEKSSNRLKKKEENFPSFLYLSTRYLVRLLDNTLRQDSGRASILCAFTLPSKNFLATHQLDVVLWTEFLCTGEREDGAVWCVSR